VQENVLIGPLCGHALREDSQLHRVLGGKISWPTAAIIAPSYQPDPRALARLAQQLVLVKAQAKEIDTQLALTVDEASDLARKLSQLMSVLSI
jgi:hypothetical protein